jgi:hypothetical protein
MWRYWEWRCNTGDVHAFQFQHRTHPDISLQTPVSQAVLEGGPINGKLVVKIINDYLLAYFDQRLKGIPAPLLFGASEEYPDLRWEKQ